VQALPSRAGRGYAGGTIQESKEEEVRILRERSDFAESGAGRRRRAIHTASLDRGRFGEFCARRTLGEASEPGLENPANPKQPSQKGGFPAALPSKGARDSDARARVVATLP
jgi:hypothetical protein